MSSIIFEDFSAKSMDSEVGSEELLRIAGVLRCARNVKAYVSEDDPETVLDPLFRMLAFNQDSARFQTFLRCSKRTAI